MTTTISITFTRTVPASSNKTKNIEEKQKKEINFNKILRNTFKCSLTHKAMKNPSVLTCGHSFENSAILEHFKTQSNCPKCEKECKGEIFPNTNLKNLIEAWREEGHGSYTTTEEL